MVDQGLEVVPIAGEEDDEARGGGEGGHTRLGPMIVVLVIKKGQ